MGIKGAKEYQNFKAGKPLTRKAALLAQCYICNGKSTEECQGTDCPIYQWSPCNKNPKISPQVSKNSFNKRNTEGLQRYRNAKKAL